MKVRINGETQTGRAIDLRGWSVTPTEVVAAVREDGESDDESLAVDCPEPRPIHKHVGLIEPELSLTVRPAMASAARSNGLSAPQDEEIAILTKKLNSFDVRDVSLRSERRRVADASGSETELREQVAALRGRVQTLRETDMNAESAESRLREATQKLSEMETERIAAEQALEQAQKRLHSIRDERVEHLRLRDRKENLERTARKYLGQQIREEFVAGVSAVPKDENGNEQLSDPTLLGPLESDSVTVALAIARIANLRAPIVLSCDRFETANSASDCLDTPVLQV
ncbi:hypothetical protein SAMN05421858_2897 [Haladaptatus litoreus]|uniref:Uncharacterized protein n=1 Tax=Haladaptatus litoreus TaxID=553468 RepID=A0A1N7C1I0_9EURY|nr:hypothetical protein [Haladaptatus litoreus]SIR57427.1 hypothetical protein SAMN05421858_2897 [Haladaptatus litoreus]